MNKWKLVFVFFLLVFVALLIRPIQASFFEPERSELVAFIGDNYLTHKNSYSSLIRFLKNERARTDTDVLLYTLPNLHTISYEQRVELPQNKSGFVYSDDRNADHFFMFFVSAGIGDARVNEYYIQVRLVNIPSLKNELYLVFPYSNTKLDRLKYSWCEELPNSNCLACATEIE